MKDVCATYSVPVFKWTATHLPPSPIHSVAEESFVLGKYYVWSGKRWLLRMSVMYGIMMGEGCLQRAEVNRRNSQYVFRVDTI